MRTKTLLRWLIFSGMPSNLWIIETIRPRRSALSSFRRSFLLPATATLPNPTASRLPKSWASSSLRSTIMRTVGFSKAGSSISRLATDGDHGIGLARSLGVPDEPTPLAGVLGPLDGPLDGSHLVRPEDGLGKLLVLAGEEDEFGDNSEHSPGGNERLGKRLEVARLCQLVPPVE